MIQLGGHAIFLDYRTTNFTLGQLTDEIQCLDRYVDAIMARVFEHSDLELMAKVSRVPIINGLSDSFHPCQAIADIMLIYERFKDLKNITVCFIGDGSNNVASSLVIGCCLLGIKIRVCAPPNYKVRDDILLFLKQKNIDGFLKQYKEPFEAVKNVNVIYTDTWVSMGQEEETAKRHKVFEEFQVNKALISHSGADPIVMHCLPAHRDYEISSEILDSKNSVVFDQAENRLHAQKALLLKLLCPEFSGVQERLF
jgi:ornithine carbamoyltransferase